MKIVDLQPYNLFINIDNGITKLISISTFITPNFKNIFG